LTKSACGAVDRIAAKEWQRPQGVPHRLFLEEFDMKRFARVSSWLKAGALAMLVAKNDHMSITHQTGERDFEMVRRAYTEAGFEGADVRPFIHDMADRFAQADVLICRSGATTAAEVAAAGKAAIFVPFPLFSDSEFYPLQFN